LGNRFSTHVARIVAGPRFFFSASRTKQKISNAELSSGGVFCQASLLRQKATRRLARTTQGRRRHCATLQPKDYLDQVAPGRFFSRFKLSNARIAGRASG
jgi:hypothetical protein